ncbi:Lysosome membrane protein 2 [Orchesella cincta]|uniref:Lysosome membrane protein 2 n=1 Tax=Orchesella cincta TaxID=48709 RepID=A0A1D2NEC1_ORCCI|nr:Lysosome membrane protein 2 [Orchesella cincta]
MKVFYILLICLSFKTTTGLWGWGGKISGFFQNKVEKTVRLIDGGFVFKLWRDADVPIYMLVRFFNVTNPDRVLKGDKPILAEVGPYVYQETRANHVDEFSLDNATVTYRTKTTYFFKPDYSNGTEDDVITTLNVPYAVMVERGLNLSSLEKFVLREIFEVNGERLFISKTVSELLFKGHFQPSVAEASALANDTLLPNNTFGFFYGKNESLSDRLEIYTGVGNPTLFAQTKSWEGRTELDFWDDQYCNMINGTDGAVFSPWLTRNTTLQIFSPDMCRSLYMVYEKDVRVTGIKGYKFVIPRNVMESAEVNPDNQCYCRGEEYGPCLKAGVMRLAPCRGGAPVVLSWPHFYNGDEDYVNQSIGLSPDAVFHEPFAIIEPYTGLIRRGSKRYQINVELKPNRRFRDMKRVPNMLFPIIFKSAATHASDRGGQNDAVVSCIENCPEGVLMKIFDKVPVQDLKNCRLTCNHWDKTILISELLDMKSAFVFDGRRDDNVGGKCATYMEESPSKNYYWSHLKFRRVGGRQTPWLFDHLEHDPDFTLTISMLELLNCSINWLIILQIMMYLPNLEVFVDSQDMYCWDYQTFNSGIEEDETIQENVGFQQIRNQDKLANLASLRVARIHRSQLVECTTYLKMLKLRCENLRELEVTTDQNFAPQRAQLFYTHLYSLLRSNADSIKMLKFPFKFVCPSHDFRATDEHHSFREFLNHITDRRWSESLGLGVLEDLSLQFGVVPIDGQDLKLRLVPFLNSLPCLKNFSMQCVFLESGMERFIEEFLREIHNSHFRPQFGIYMNDAAGVPNILNFQRSLRSLSIQTFREMAKQLKDLIPLFGIETYEDLKELQYFSKNHTFRNFNLDMLIESFSNLTHLNLVDHNSRLETRHTCEALATIEDPDLQLIIKHLRKLVSLQLIANMTFLTDVGMTGIDMDICKRMQSRNLYVLTEDDIVTGMPISKLQNLRFLVLRGLGIKVTDITPLFAFNGMPLLKKLHLCGSHQVSVLGRSSLSQQFNATRGCDLQV